MTTFYDLLKELAQRIADPRSGLAESGSTTTLVDSLLAEPDNYYNNGNLFLDQATPIIVRITDYASSTGTFTFPAIDVAVTAALGYTACHARYPLDQLKFAINAAILESELYMEVDETLTLVADQERYTLPSGVTENVRRIEIGTVDEDDWEIHYGWKIENSQLRFLANAPSDTSKTCRIHYAKQHAALTNLADVLSPKVSRKRLIVSACKNALMWRNYKVGRDEPNTTEYLNYYLEQYNRVQSLRETPLLERDPILARY